MGLFDRRSPDEPRGRAVVASAARLNLGDPKVRLRRTSEWQTQAWDYYDVVPEVKYPTTYLGNALARLRLFVAERPDPDDEPVPTQNAQAIEALERLEAGMGGHSEMLRELTVNLTIPGECYLVGRGERPDEPEEWDVRSVDELKEVDRRWYLLDEPNQQPTQGRQLDPDLDFVARMWIRHPRFSKLPDSPMRSILDACDQLQKLDRAFRAILVNRAVNSGFLLVPDELSFAGKDEETSDNPIDEETDRPSDEFLDELFETMETAIANPGSAAAVVPNVVRGKAEFLKEFRHLTLERPLDPVLLELQTRSIRRLAHGFNLPVEVVLGHQQTTFANAAQISIDTFKAHIEPLAVAECDLLTIAYLRPMLEDAGVPNAGDYMLWYDPSNLVVRPNRTDDALQLHDRGAISDEALRRTTDFPEDDAPDDDEIERRIRWRSNSPEDDAQSDEETEPVGTDEGTPGMARRLVAAGGRSAEDSLSRQLLEIDRILRNRLEGAIDAALRRLLERAGARLRSKLGRSEHLQVTTRNVPNSLVAATLGPSIVAGLGVTEDELIQGAFSALERQFLAWVELAQRDALALVPGLNSQRRQEAEELQAIHRREAWEWLRLALEDHARTLLYDPSPHADWGSDPEEPGLVPLDIIREAIARAGGRTSAAVAASRAS